MILVITTLNILGQTVSNIQQTIQQFDIIQINLFNPTNASHKQPDSVCGFALHPPHHCHRLGTASSFALPPPFNTIANSRKKKYLNTTFDQCISFKN